MPIAVRGDMPREAYDAANEKMFGTTRPNEPIDGLIVHTVTEGPDGFRIFDVWESREAFETFLNDRVMPALEEAGMAFEGGQPPEVVEIVHMLVNEGARASSA